MASGSNGTDIYNNFSGEVPDGHTLQKTSHTGSIDMVYPQCVFSGDFSNEPSLQKISHSWCTDMACPQYVLSGELSE